MTSRSLYSYEENYVECQNRFGELNIPDVEASSYEAVLSLAALRYFTAAGCVRSQLNRKPQCRLQCFTPKLANTGSH